MRTGEERKRCFCWGFKELKRLLVASTNSSILRSTYISSISIKSGVNIYNNIMLRLEMSIVLLLIIPSLLLSNT